MSLHQDIKSQMVEAMKAKEALRLSVIRGLLSSFTNEAVAKGKKPDEELSDEDVLGVISKAVKQRKDSIEQFEKGGRADLAESEKEELVILQAYLPSQMSEEEVEAFVKAKIESENPDKDPSTPFDNTQGKPLGASKKGQFMGSIMKELKGKADGSHVKAAVDKFI
ncbi:MAG: GatB/YqeY domain-containing protein [Candidatus Zambryskibacteria bacterium]|nr:GatB/YqeY domain-containing protein [Candidatus Zambryskibacteria bacterium]